MSKLGMLKTTIYRSCYEGNLKSLKEEFDYIKSCGEKIDILYGEGAFINGGVRCAKNTGNTKILMYLLKYYQDHQVDIHPYSSVEYNLARKDLFEAIWKCKFEEFDDGEAPDFIEKIFKPYLEDPSSGDDDSDKSTIDDFEKFEEELTGAPERDVVSYYDESHKDSEEKGHYGYHHASSDGEKKPYEKELGGVTLQDIYVSHHDGE